MIASRSDGGACHFLRGNRCACHPVRPGTCGEFPLTVYVDGRVQVSLVLTCPGVDLSTLYEPATVGAGSEVEDDFRIEVEFLESEIRRAESAGQLRTAFQRRRSTERRLRRMGRWQAEPDVRRRLQPVLDEMIPTELGVQFSGPEEESLESLPMFFDPDAGRVAWRPHAGGMEFFTLRDTGGVDEHLGVVPSPTRSPGLDGLARRLLVGYLTYVLERDATVGAAYSHILRGAREFPEAAVAMDLREIAARVIRLGAVRRSLTTDRRGVLTGPDIESGIRATDMDILDRPATGLRL